MLDIIVTHYDEPWNVCRPFFDMLGCQRGIDFSDIRVTLVHDGTDLFADELLEYYPYEIVQHRIAHGGVSVARNYGFDHSDGEWVEFCDIDDCYTHIYALRMILSQMDRDVDYMWTPFFTEHRKRNFSVACKEKENIVWVHGKYFRRKFIEENKIRFPEGIHYSEDSGFCVMVNELAKPGRRGKIKTEFPVYVWTFRKESVTNKPENMARNLTGFIDRNEWVVAEFKRRGIDHVGMVGRMFADAYWAFHSKYQFPDQEKRFARMSRKHVEDLKKNDDETIAKLLVAASNAFRPGEINNKESFQMWLDRLDEIAEER